MRYRILAMFAFMAVIAVQVAQAQTAPETPPTPASQQLFTPEQTREARQALEAVGKAMGVETPPSPGASADPTVTHPSEHKTVGDALDKGLNLTATAVSKISGMLEQVAPRVWRIFVIQQYAKAISGLVVPWGMVFLCFTYVRLIRKYWAPSEQDLKDTSFLDKDGEPTFWLFYGLFTRWAPYTVSFFFAWWGLTRVAEAAKMAINPEFYAVKDLIQVLLAPGTM